MIFPKSSLAVLVYNVRDLVEQPATSSAALGQVSPALNETLLLSMKRFTAREDDTPNRMRIRASYICNTIYLFTLVHRNSIGVLISDDVELQHGRNIFHELQRQFLCSSFTVMMVNSIQGIQNYTFACRLSSLSGR